MTDSDPMVHGQSDAKSLDQRLRSAFQTETEASISREDKFAEIKAGFENGRYGGYPIKATALSAMLVVLDQLKWVVSVGQITRNMPHFADNFGRLDMLEVMARMDYVSERRPFKRNRIHASHLPGIVCQGTEIFILVEGEDGKISAHDPDNGKIKPLHEFRDATQFSFKHQPRNAANENKSWMQSNLSRFWREVLELFSLTFVINLMVLIVSLSVMSIYDKVIPANAYDTLIAIGIGVMLALGLELIFRNLKAKLIGTTTGRLEYLLATAVFGKLISLPIQYVVNTPVGDQLARLRQLETVRDLFSGPFVAVGLELPFVVAFTVGLFIMTGPLGYVPLAMIVGFMIIGALVLGPIKRQSERAGRHRREHYQTSLETVSNLRQLRSLGCEEVWLDRLSKKTAENASAKRRANLSQRFLTTLSNSTVPIAGSSTVALGALMVMDGTLSVGMLIGAMIIIWRILAPIQQMFLMLTKHAEISRMVGQFDQMMKLPSAVVENHSHVHRVFSGQVSFDRASFRYQGAADAALQGLNIEIQPGELVAIKGSSGSGKSTLLRLILDLYRPQVGSVQVDGVNVRQIPPYDLRATIGYVPQKPALFHGTIAQNLRLASPAATDKELENICAEVGILAAIQAQPDGINTLLDYGRASSLPGGFRQALSIAQALLRKPRILLLDDPAKTLDHALEEALMNCISKRRGSTTIVMVSHRPSHIRLADRVLTLDRGQMVSFDAPSSPQPRSA